MRENKGTPTHDAHGRERMSTNVDIHPAQLLRTQDEYRVKEGGEPAKTLSLIEFVDETQTEVRRFAVDYTRAMAIDGDKISMHNIREEWKRQFGVYFNILSPNPKGK